MPKFRSKKSRSSRAGWSEAGKNYVDMKTKYLIEDEKKTPEQAYAIATSMARAMGYKV